MVQKYTENSLFYSLTSKYIFAKIRGMRYTLKDFQKEYPDDDACLEAVFQDRFGHVKFCPKCAAETKFYRVKKRQCYACMHCGYQLHPLASTIFRKTTTPLTSWFYAIYLFSVSKNGVSAKELARHLGVTYKTAWRMCKQIRILMQQENEKLSGTVEVDETYIGGRHRMSRGRRDKSIIIGAIEKDGRAKANVIDWASAARAMSFLNATLVVGAELHTDDSRIYKRAKQYFKHGVVNHSQKVYVENGVHTNSIEGFWGQLKRSISGTYHVVSPKYLQLYVDEFVFRYNLRGVAVGPVLLERALRPVLSVA